MGKQIGGKAIRLTYSFVGDKISLRSTRLLRKRVPGGDARLGKELPGKGLGCWIELRSADGKILYRRKCSAFTPQNVEVRTGNASRPFKRMRGEFKEGTFSVFVPMVEGGRQLALVERLRVDNGEIKVVERDVTDLEKIKIDRDGGRIEQ